MDCGTECAIFYDFGLSDFVRVAVRRLSAAGCLHSACNCKHSMVH
jgi:hypothetical protein